MDTATLKAILLASSFATLLLLEARGAHPNSCSLDKYRRLKDKERTFRLLRNRYEELRVGNVEPWPSCLGERLQPKWKLDGLTKWEMLDAVEMEVNLAIHALQNATAHGVDRHVPQVLAIFTPLRKDLLRCIHVKPASLEATGDFPEFLEEFQQFNISNTAQSPQCLELAVGLNIVQTLTDVRQVSQEHSEHRHRSLHRSLHVHRLSFH
ncbi:hypothetical protein lerEdw1_009611 [Lerista edwardsae]|nr:hypothetical protein lerEdw1_009611 [Lerista edwardsae]